MRSRKSGDGMTKKTRNLLIVIVIAAGVVYLVWPRAMGYIKLDTPSVHSQLTLKGSWYGSRQLDSKSEASEIREGEYNPGRIELNGEKDGHTWRLSGSGPWGELSKVEVTPKQTMVLKPGPPLKVKAAVREFQGSVNVDYTIIGRMGEHYKTVVRDGKSILPTVKIVDREGKVLSQGKFEFG
jgi:hypothetical protein